MSVSLLKVSVTASVIGFLAYCVYFDRKRRSDPDFKAKLKQKRLNAKKSQENKYEDIPIFKSPDEMQAYFLKEVQLGDAAMATGDMQEAIIHFANATVVCTQKSYFLDAMQKSLPAPMFQVLYQQYRIVNDRYFKRVLESQTGGLSKLNLDNAQFIEDPDIE